MIGLTTALRLLQNGCRIIVVASHGPADKDINYTSPWAGAHYRPIPDIDEIELYEADLARSSYDMFKIIAATDESGGVQMMDGFEYFDSPSDEYLGLKGRYSDIDDFRVLKESELPSGVKFGTMYKTWTLNPLVYLAWLKQQLVLGGVQFVNHRLTSILEAFAVVKDIDSRIVINCSGFGFSDPNVYPTRGMFCT